MQKYQVFINEHLIVIDNVEKSNQHSLTALTINNPSKDNLSMLANWLLIETEGVYTVNLVVENTDSFWELFKSEFKWIEAAGGLVKNNLGQYLFIYRLDKWDLPKGKIETGEGVQEAAIREVEEECGVSALTITSDLPSTFHIYSHKDKLVLKKTHWFNMITDSQDVLIPEKEENIEKAVWVDPSQVEEKLKNTYASLESIIRSILIK